MRISVLVVVLVMLGSTVANAQALRVVPVPMNGSDPTIPHVAYNGHATTFKAIARGGNGTYLYEWDFTGDGVYDFSTLTSNRYNLGVRFTFPNQAATTTFQAKVRVTSNGQTVVGVYPVRIFADVPANPVLASDRQLQVMRTVAIDDGLWFLHAQMSRAGNEEDVLVGAQATGSISGFQTEATSGFLQALGLTGHYAAFPPAYLGAIPIAAENAARWNNDPYAEDAMRLVNTLLAQMTPTTIPASDEVNTVGFYPEVSASPIASSDDGIGLRIGVSGSDTQLHGQGLAAIAVARLGSYVAQVGDASRVLGKPFTLILQQLVDYTVFSQADFGEVGSWYYTPNNSTGDLENTLYALTGLWHAERFGTSQGVIVPNIVKARLVQYLQTNRNTCPEGGTGGSYGSSSNNICDFVWSSAHLLGLGWVGANLGSASDSRLAFPSYSSTTFAQLRTAYDSTFTYIANAFTTTNPGSMGAYESGFVASGDFARVDGRGNHYGMMTWRNAANAVTPTPATFGANNWSRQFSRYLINNQAANGDWNWVHDPAVAPNTDSNGGAPVRVARAIRTLSPDALPPLAIGQASVAAAPEGTSINFSGAASDPGAGTPIYTWAFGNGASMTGRDVAYAYPDNGMFNATLTITGPGGTSVDTIPVTITNVAPTPFAGDDATVAEGTSLPFALGFTDPGTADTFTFAWNFGDATTSNAQNVIRAYADNGVFNVTGRVTDDDGGTNVDVRVVTVTNVAPTITSTPSSFAMEAAQYTYLLTFTDPGAADTHACSAPVRPAGSALVGCQLVWTPDFSQAIGSAVPIRQCVTDDDGGQTCQDFAVTVGFIDSDGDSLPDSWEISNFGNITSQDQFGDADGDGMNNLQEFSNVTDPLTYDGPNVPSPLGPTCGVQIASSVVTLIANNAVDPQGTPLDYNFELYSDAGLTSLIASQSGIPQGAGATTSWSPATLLQENGHYYWRVRGRDAFTFGPYSPVCDFTVNAINEAPSAPGINAPAIGGQATSLRPTLVVDNAADPDGDVLTYSFEVYRDAAFTMSAASQTGVASAAGSTSWQLTVDLVEDAEYYWRARAVDAAGLAGPYTASGRFLVTTTNGAPATPTLVSPQNGTVAATHRPVLVVLAAGDPDRDAVTYEWAIATDATFATIVEQAAAATTTFALSADLSEDTRYCWRARSSDGVATSDYASACFVVSAQNDAPSVPTLANPSNASSVTTLTPIYSWMPATDPEGATLAYDLEVRDGGGAIVASATGVGGTVAAPAGALVDGATYTWRVRAVDGDGAAGAFSADNSFTVALPAIPDPVDPEPEPESSCSAGGSPNSAAVLGLALIGLARRRRRR